MTAGSDSKILLQNGQWEPEKIQEAEAMDMSAENTLEYAAFRYSFVFTVFLEQLTRSRCKVTTGLQVATTQC